MTNISSQDNSKQSDEHARKPERERASQWAKRQTGQGLTQGGTHTEESLPGQWQDVYENLNKDAIAPDEVSKAKVHPRTAGPRGVSGGPKTVGDNSDGKTKGSQ